MLTGLLLGMMLIMRLFPETPLAKTLHCHLVERPVDWVQNRTRHDLLFYLALTFMLLVGDELVVMLGSFELAMMFAWDVSLYVDALIATSALSAAGRWKGLTAWMRGKIAVARPAYRRRTRRRARRQISVSKSARPANDDDGDPAFVLAA